MKPKTAVGWGIRGRCQGFAGIGKPLLTGNAPQKWDLEGCRWRLENGPEQNPTEGPLPAFGPCEKSGQCERLVFRAPGPP